MPVSAARRRSNDAYNAKCDYINLRPLKPEGVAIRAAAAAAGMSLQGYILRTVRAQMERDGQFAALDRSAEDQPTPSAE